ncbi:hypothetical protein [Nocardia crassostreae]|uniref:hypothetical protein n=1 Tax=Nocardia crassostreae TaxID=53428 RepID=UPI0012F89C43|nr:hypothetical protein [Nocardia crassostreae]
MAIVMSSVAVEMGGGSSIEQAAAATRRVISEAGRTPEQIHALISTGVYRDSRIVEPAMSALIQQQAEIGLEYRGGEVPCLSIDLMNGACGVLDAIQMSQALLAAPTVDRVVIVSGDAHPSASPDPQPGFPIKPVGAALMLEKGNGSGGFGALHISSIDGHPAAAEELLHHAVAAGSEALEVADSPVERTLLLCNRPMTEFPALLAARLGLPAAAVCTDAVEGWADHHTGDGHTSALPTAYVAARDAGRLDGVDVALFVAAGAGRSAAAIAYRLPKG